MCYGDAPSVTFDGGSAPTSNGGGRMVKGGGYTNDTDDARGMSDIARERVAKRKPTGPIIPPTPDPLAIFGPRIESASVTGVLPGQVGKRVGVSDLKIGV